MGRRVPCKNRSISTPAGPVACLRSNESTVTLVIAIAAQRRITAPAKSQVLPQRLELFTEPDGLNGITRYAADFVLIGKIVAATADGAVRLDDDLLVDQLTRSL